MGETVNLKEQLVQPLVLQIVCTELWTSLSAETRVIRTEDLRVAGDIGQAIIHFYDDVIHDVSMEVGESEGRLRAWIESTFVTEHGTRGTAYRGIDMTADMPNKVPDALVARHLLAEERRAMSAWYQLAQDRLISAVQRSNATWRTRHHEQSPEPAYGSADADKFRAAAEEAFGVGNYASAHRFAQVAASRYRSTGDDRRLAHTLVLEGDIARSEGDFPTAQESLRAALSTFDILQDRYSTVRTLSALADLCASNGDYATAEEFQRQAVSRLPTDVDALIGLGYAQWYGGAPADAETTFTQALGWNLRAGRALAGRGQVRVEMREYETGLKDLNNALEVGVPPADEIDCRSARAVALAGTGQIAAAEHELVMARSQDPRRARTHLRAARVARIIGHKTEERKELEDALRGIPKLSTFEEETARRSLTNLG
jgi:tetratricopeptide (TPR) repeat protein